MKLRNKRTGDIYELNEFCLYDDKGFAKRPFLRSLAELNEEWEDYEEPKTINEIDVVLDAISEYCNEHSYYSGDLEKIKILNVVEEKLKAWKRLKGKGFRFNSCEIEVSEIVVPKITISAFIDTEEPGTLKLVNLLFGGKE